eukprot:TRINITY_DN1172_c0_g1_i9.p1 TRINITY_DN1172_c0_g1~~TRINITY_DN1172_c0_g1_i9.p1  ORF type:complete len:533 (+),score=102.30 TRINITY_DN1172_c0_g1_i9:90-1688(+)
MSAMKILRVLASLLIMAQLSSAFRKRVRGALRSSTEPKALLAELEQALGTEEWAIHELQGFEEDLKVTFKALPKNARGAIEAPSARYALHRLFIQRHGWMVKGLETGGGAWDAESPIVAMDAHVPKEMRELFEDRLGNYGMTLHELAVLAATMKKMFERDVEQRLRIVYEGMNLVEKESLDLAQAHEVMLTYAGAYIVGPQLEDLTTAFVPKAVADLKEKFPRSKQAEDLLIKIRMDIAPGSGSFDFALMVKVLSKFGHQLGALEDTECQVMKERLVAREHRSGSGRVRLGDFYAAGNGFVESPEYLRARGALDESNPEDPKVLIPNYLANPSMCLTPSGYYSICCFDECESLMDQIESGIEAPMGTPEKIASLVSALPSFNRTLSPTLLQLLDEVAGHHGGMIPVHGRLFSQWMHQAFPRECSFPHVTGVVDRYGQQDSWVHSKVQHDERQRYFELAHRAQVDAPVEADAPMWTMHEELVDRKAIDKHLLRSSRIEDLLLCGTVSFVGFMLAKSLLTPVLSSRMSAKSKLL